MGAGIALTAIAQLQIGTSSRIGVDERERTTLVSEFVRPVLFVSTDTTLHALLRLFVGGRHHFAIVKDRSGKVAGMVTLEDMLETNSMPVPPS